jgi:DNA-binding IclR family transcriptional regulator
MSSQHVQAIEHEWRILRCLARADKPMAFGEIATATGCYGATLHRVLGALKTEGVLAEPSADRWEIGPGIAELAGDAVLQAILGHLNRVTEIAAEVRGHVRPA